MDCNFKCWYCYEDCEIGSKMSEDTKSNIIKMIENKIKNKEISRVELNWFGGEPMMFFYEIIYPISIKIKELCKKNNLIFSNAITTNGYLLKREIIEKLNDISLNHFHITLDGNKDTHDKTRILKNNDPTYDTIVKNINMICSEVRDASILLRINYKNDTIESINEIIADFKKENRAKIEINFHRIWQTINKNVKCIDIKSIKDHFINEGFLSGVGHYYNIYRGSTCYASKWNQVVVNYDGNVYKCTAEKFKAKNKLGSLKNDGSIDWDVTKIMNWFGNATFENEICLKCELLPMCAGLCPAKYIQLKDKRKLKDVCPYNQDSDFTLKDYIISKYNEFLSNN